MKQRLLASMAVVAGLALGSTMSLAADPMSNDGAGAPSAAPGQSKAELIGDKVIDGSARAQLAALETAIKA